MTLHLRWKPLRPMPPSLIFVSTLLATDCWVHTGCSISFQTLEMNSSLTIPMEDFRVGCKRACSASQESDLSSKTFLPSVSQPSSQPSFSALPSVFSFVMSLDTFSSIHQPDRILITFSWQAKSSSYLGKCPFSNKAFLHFLPMI